MLFVHGVGHFHPDNVLDNAFLEALDIGVDSGWILERVGIERRRTVLPLDYIRSTRNRDPRAAAEAALFTNAQTGALAARHALERGGIGADAVKLVLCGSCSPQWTIPAEACVVAAELGVEAPCFDVSSACSTLAAQLHFLDRFEEASFPDFALLLQVDNNTRVVDYNDRKTAVLWGDASSALLVSKRHPSQVRIRRTCLHSEPSGWNRVVVPTGGHFMQDGPAVQRFAIRKGVSTFEELVEGRRAEERRVHLIGHQANLLALQGVCARVEVPVERHLHNVAEFGNCGAAGAPSVLSQNWDRFDPGDEVAVVVVGSGLTWGGALFTFEECS